MPPRPRASRRRGVHRRLRRFRLHRGGRRADDLRGRPGRRQGAQPRGIPAHRQPGAARPGLRPRDPAAGQRGPVATRPRRTGGTGESRTGLAASWRSAAKGCSPSVHGSGRLHRVSAASQRRRRHRRRRGPAPHDRSPTTQCRSQMGTPRSRQATRPKPRRPRAGATG